MIRSTRLFLSPSSFSPSPSVSPLFPKHFSSVGFPHRTSPSLAITPRIHPQTIGTRFLSPAERTHKLKVDDHLGNEEWKPAEHHVWSQEELTSVEQTHKKPEVPSDHFAFAGTKLVRLFFDIGSGYAFGPVTEKKLLRRIIFLETVAGIPGMVAGSLRHLRSLRRIERDMGWIQTLLDEAENERMHLLVFREIAKPSLLMKFTVGCSQIIAWNSFFAFYLFAPSVCHRFVGYVEEEAVHTYTGAIELLQSGKLPEWENKACPEAGVEYWGLPQDAKMIDLLLAVRADEAHHRDVNHQFADLKKTDPNPIQKRTLPGTP